MSALLLVQVGPYTFGAPVAAVTEILARLPVTRVPRTPPVVAGVAVVRGQPLPVFTCAPALGLDGGPITVALRWGAVLVAVDGVDALWTPGDPLDPTTWQDIVPVAARPWIDAGYRQGTRWVWGWPPDLPERLAGSRDAATGEGGRAHG